MTEVHFNHQMNRLRNFYGKEKLPLERVSYIFKVLGRLRDDDFTEVCSEIIANHNTAPTLKDFVKAAEKYIIFERNKRQDEERASFQFKANCETCHDVGVLNATDRLTKNKTLILCKCDKGDFWSLPKLNPIIEKKFEVTKIEAKEYRPIFENNKFVQSIFECADGFKTKIKIAESFWVQKQKEGA